MKSKISEENFKEMSEAIEKLGELFKKNKITHVQLTYNTLLDDVECAFSQEEGETN